MSGTPALCCPSLRDAPHTHAHTQSLRTPEVTAGASAALGAAPGTQRRLLLHRKGPLTAASLHSAVGEELHLSFPRLFSGQKPPVEQLLASWFHMPRSTSAQPDPRASLVPQTPDLSPAQPHRP